MSESEWIQLEEEGYVVIRNALSATKVEALNHALARVLDGHAYGRQSFEGERTQRVYALLGKCHEVAPLVEDPRILEIGERFFDPGFLISSVQAIKIHPGQTMQPLHCDDDAGAGPRPRAPQGFSTMWALQDFTADNGSTRLVPRSHRLEAEPRVAADVVNVEMKAGSVLVYLGGVLHGGGANTSDRMRLGISVIYCQPWLRQFESLMLSIPPATAVHFSERIQKMLGYSMLGPMGNIDGRDPMRWLHAATARTRTE